MVLTRRQYKDISRWFPNEIIAEVVQVAPQADQAALCRVSRLFHSVGIPVLYRAVEVVGRDSMKAVSLVILSNPLLPDLVRSFSATGDRAQWSDTNATSTPQILSALKLLLRLEDLSLIHFTIREEDRHSFLQLSFPCLRGCHFDFSTIGGGIFPLVFYFAQHHPSLRSLFVSMSGNAPGDPLLPLRLPHLRRLSGPLCLVSSITGAQDLREVRLRWPFGDKKPSAHEVEKTIRTLKSMILDETAFVFSNDECSGIYADVLESVSSHLPHTKTLRLRMQVESWTGLPDYKKFEHLRNHLPHFTNLRFLSSTMHRIDSLEVSRSTVKDVSDIYPSLEECCFNQRAWRRVNGTWEELPYQDFMRLAGISFP
ncbi:hypothetical protein C8R47DRAFT_517426 [Mycena vitilis]|nr:hypothetical protein C8R47DRAFT_517426 [Mycena vitilis]